MSMYTNLQTFQGIAASQRNTTLHALHTSHYSPMSLSVFGNGYSSAPAATAPAQTAEQKQAAQLANTAAALNNIILGVSVAKAVGGIVDGGIKFLQSLAPASKDNKSNPSAGSPTAAPLDASATTSSLQAALNTYNSSTGGNADALNTQLQTALGKQTTLQAAVDAGTKDADALVKTDTDALAAANKTQSDDQAKFKDQETNIAGLDKTAKAADKEISKDKDEIAGCQKQEAQCQAVIDNPKSTASQVNSAKLALSEIQGREKDAKAKLELDKTTLADATKALNEAKEEHAALKITIDTTDKTAVSDATAALKAAQEAQAEAVKTLAQNKAELAKLTPVINQVQAALAKLQGGSPAPAAEATPIQDIHEGSATLSPSSTLASTEGDPAPATTGPVGTPTAPTASYIKANWDSAKADVDSAKSKLDSAISHNFPQGYIDTLRNDLNSKLITWRSLPQP